MLDLLYLRRLLTITGAFVATAVVVATSPVLFGVTWLVDRVRGDRHLPRYSVARLVGVLGINECVWLVRLLWVWFRYRAGRSGEPDEALTTVHRIMMGGYTSSLLRWVTWAFGTTVQWSSRDLGPGPMVVAARHTSFFDAVIPAALLTQHNDLLPAHVVTRGLRYSPCIDIVGGWIPTQFIDRTPERASAEIDGLVTFGQVANNTTATIIFPEGTFRTPERFDRAIAKLTETEPQAAVRARQLRHGLPPRPAGLWALLEGCPNADLGVITNTGLEKLATVRSIRSTGQLTSPVTISCWRIDRELIPRDFASFSSWLLDEYQVIDDWVEGLQPIAELESED